MKNPSQWAETCQLAETIPASREKIRFRGILDPFFIMDGQPTPPNLQPPRNKGLIRPY